MNTKQALIKTLKLGNMNILINNMLLLSLCHHHRHTGRGVRTKTVDTFIHTRKEEKNTIAHRCASESARPGAAGTTNAVVYSHLDPTRQENKQRQAFRAPGAVRRRHRNICHTRIASSSLQLLIMLTTCYLLTSPPRTRSASLGPSVIRSSATLCTVTLLALSWTETTRHDWKQQQRQTNTMRRQLQREMTISQAVVVAERLVQSTPFIFETTILTVPSLLHSHLLPSTLSHNNPLYVK